MVVPDRRCSRTPGWGPLDSGWKDDAGGWDFGDYGAVGGGGKWGGPDKLGSWTVTMDMKLARFLPPGRPCTLPLLIYGGCMERPTLDECARG